MVIEALDAANPSSVHAEGRAARAFVEDARRALADLLDCNPGNVTFTSGASEAIATALAPKWLLDGKSVDHSRLAVVETDHAAMLAGGHFEAEAVTMLPVDLLGRVKLDALRAWIEASPHEGPSILAIGLANSETGVLQDIEAIAAAIEGKDIRLVVDAVQVVGRLPFSLSASHADAVIVSSHKIGGPKGVGALVLGDTATRPFPLIPGGGQEKGRRSGTEPVAAIAGFGAAARAASFDLRNDKGTMSAMRDAMESHLRGALPDLVILGEGAPRLPNTSSIAHPGLKAETAQIGLDLCGFAVSAGSACSKPCFDRAVPSRSRCGRRSRRDSGQHRAGDQRRRAVELRRCLYPPCCARAYRADRDKRARRLTALRRRHTERREGSKRRLFVPISDVYRMGLFRYAQATPRPRALDPGEYGD